MQIARLCKEECTLFLDSLNQVENIAIKLMRCAAVNYGVRSNHADLVLHQIIVWIYIYIYTVYIFIF